MFFMEHKKALNILISMQGRYSLKAEEKEAVLTAIGVLSWSYLAQSRIKAKKAKQNKSSTKSLVPDKNPNSFSNSRE